MQLGEVPFVFLHKPNYQLVDALGGHHCHGQRRAMCEEMMGVRDQGRMAQGPHIHKEMSGMSEMLSVVRIPMLNNQMF